MDIKSQTHNLLIQCAIQELLIADSLSHETNMNEKVFSLHRMIQFTKGIVPSEIRFLPQILVADDSFSTLKKILP